uniref:Uncharacterized protein LOC104211883 n=1 Tax=Nicotiana sylvestris TaxID=4096 RepID=A0A1U7UYT2_NICSY|nr:PREDICTED: uncharacterized protein LOC104211883 [Nicotiana sylvestris]
METALQKGPWFIFGNFLSVQCWEPNFVPSRAKQIFTAIWIRLPELPTKFYDEKILNKVGNTIGRLLKVDACTSAALRGRYARICVELPLNKQVKSSVWIGSHKQQILYECDKLLCLNCGFLGHSTGQCVTTKIQPYTSITKGKDAEKEGQSNSIQAYQYNITQEEQHKALQEDQHTSKEEWQAVTFKKGKFLTSQTFCDDAKGHHLF